MRRAALVAALAAVLVAPPAASAQRADEFRLQPVEAEVIARADPKVRERRDLKLTARAEREGGRRWKVGFFRGDSERVQVIVDDRTGRILESWDGYQVAWQMARGYEGAFGRKLNAPYIWLPLCAIFFFAFFDRRRPWRMAHLDLLVLLGFGVSHFFFNRGEIGLSVPLAYPFLIYLLVRMLQVGLGRSRPDLLRPAVPVVVLAIGTIALLGGRIALNAVDSNVIDVGYAGVIGADRIGDGEAIYGTFPSENHAGDTYGPAVYFAYVPFEQALSWSGEWDDLPAAHGAAGYFDLITALVLFLLGRRLREGEAGTTLGVCLAFAWASFPYTTFVLESNANDALVAVLVATALLIAGSPFLRGATLAAATLTKFAPGALIPIFGAASAGDPEGARRRLVQFTGGLALAGTLLMLWPAIDPGLETFWERTVAFQGDRDSPFGIWNLWDLPDLLLSAFRAGVVVLILALALRARRASLWELAAFGGAALIAVEIALSHWFYLYIVWFLPLALVALAASGPPRRRYLVKDLLDGESAA